MFSASDATQELIDLVREKGQEVNAVLGEVQNAGTLPAEMISTTFSELIVRTKFTIDAIKAGDKEGEATQFFKNCNDLLQKLKTHLPANEQKAVLKK
jgi:hypothetical protein